MADKKTPNPIDVHVGSRVRFRRMVVGLSQEKLGDKLGITFQQVQKYEKGTNRIGASRLQAISNILEVPVAFFFEDVAGGSAQSTGLGEVKQQDYIVDFLTTNEGLHLTRAFMKIKSAPVRKRIIDLVQTIAEQES